MGIVTNLFSRKGSKEEPAFATMPARPAAPNLIMLMPDASGIASYQLHTFVAASEAEAYLVSILRGDVQEGTIMFWALTWMPTSDGSQEVGAEPVVLIRDPSRPGLVYTFSFVDLDSAYDFVRHEVKTGLDLSQTAIFWAVPAEATANHWGEITVTPGNPPTRELATNGGAPLAVPTPLVAPDHNEPLAVPTPLVAPDHNEPLAAPTPLTAPDHNEPLAAPTPLTAPDHDEPNGTQPHIDETPPVRLPELDSDGSQATDEPETVNESEAASEPQAAEEAAHKAIDDADISNVIDILQAKGLRAPSSSPQPTDEPELPEDATHTADEPSDTGNGFPHAGQETVHIDLNDVFDGRRDPDTLTALSEFRREAPAANGLHAGPEGVIEAPDETASGIVIAWSNIGAAIDRAIDAHVSRRVGATIAWRRLTTAFAAAASVRMLITWRAIAQALYAGAAIQAARERGLATAWRNIAHSFRQAAESKSGRRAVRLVWANISWTLEEAVYAARLQQKKTARQAWSTASNALAVAALKQNAIDRGIRTAWHRLAVASLDAAQAQEARRAGCAIAWANTGIALNEFTTAKLHHDGLIAAWTRLAAAIEEAAEATARHNGLIRAWRNIARACSNAAQASLVRQMAYRQSWLRLTTALAEAGIASLRRDAALAAWDVIGRAFGDALAAKAYHDRCGAIQAWSNAALAFNEATVAEAQLRIAHAGLDDKAMKGVTAAIRKAKGREVASIAGKAAEQAIKVATGETVSAKEATKATKPAKVTSGHGKSRTAPQAAAEKTVAGQASPTTPNAVEKRLTAEETAAAIENWRFTDKKGRFESFDSPPGRF